MSHLFDKQYAYKAGQASSVSRLSLPNTAYITNAYDGMARLLSTSLKNSGNTNLDSYAYGYNQGNQRTNLIRTDGSFGKVSVRSFGTNLVWDKLALPRFGGQP